jgi:hypothetical protein
MKLSCLLRLAWIGAAGLPFAARLQEPGPPPPTDASQAEVPSPSEPLREELFAIEQVEGAAELELGAVAPNPAQGDAAAEPAVLGVARCRRLSIPDGLQLEWDVQFLGEDAARVLHIERSNPAGDTLVWREMLPGSGRTVSARCSQDALAITLREWAGRTVHQSELASPQGLRLPLHLLELLRSGARPPSEAHVFDPLARQLEPVAIRARELESGARKIDLLRNDGTLAASWLLEGGDLVAFQWQGGNVRARRISAEEHERLLLPPAPPREP